MEKEITRLKLNATNIKNSLVSSNKELKKLRVQKKDLFFKLEKQKEVRAEEKRLETPQIGNSFKRLFSTVTTPAKNIFDGILEFFGLIAVRTLIGELPKLISKVDAFFNSGFMKTVVGILTAVGTGIQKVGELIGLIPKQEKEQIMNELKEIEKNVDLDLPLADQTDKDIVTLAGLIAKGEENQPPLPESTPQPTVVIEQPEKSSGSQPVQPIQSSQPTLTPQAQTTPSSEKGREPQKFSKGGTVKSEDEDGKPIYQPKKSIALKRSQRALTDGFGQFSIAVGNISESAEQDEKNMLALAEVSKNFNKWNSMLKFFGGDDGSSGDGDGGDGGDGGGGGDSGGGSLTSGKWGPMLDLISSGEGGYSSVNPSLNRPEIQDMNLEQLLAFKAESKKQNGGSAALGRYQFINPELAYSLAGINPKEKFTPANQDKMAVAYLEKKRRGKEWLAGKITTREYIEDLAREWGAFRSYSGFVLPNNSGKIGPEKIEAALKKVKKGGYSQEELSKNIDPVQEGKTKTVVSSRYGVIRGNRMHGGTDIATNSGAPLRAVADGTIIETGFEKGWGYFLVYKDTSGLYHLYGHMPKGSYKTKGAVKKGEVIGKVGSTGRSSGPHLHWEIGKSWNGSIGGKFDPLSLYTKDAPFNTQLKPVESKQNASLIAQTKKEQKTQEAVNAIFLTQKKTQYVPVVMPAPKTNSLTTRSASLGLSPLWGV